MNIIGFAILLLIVVVFSAMFPNALTDLAARIRTLRAGAVPLQRRGGYASHSHAEAYSAPVRPSPGHRNFGVPPRAPEVDASSFTPFPDLR